MQAYNVDRKYLGSLYNLNRAMAFNQKAISDAEDVINQFIHKGKGDIKGMVYLTNGDGRTIKLTGDVKITLAQWCIY